MHVDLCNVVMHVHAGLCNANLYVRVGLQYVMQVYMCIGLYNVGLIYKGLCNVSLYVHVSLHVCSGEVNVSARACMALHRKPVPIQAYARSSAIILQNKPMTYTRLDRFPQSHQFLSEDTSIEIKSSKLQSHHTTWYAFQAIAFLLSFLCQS